MSDLKNVPPRFEAALERLDGDRLLLQQMALVTSEDLPVVMERVEAAIENGNLEQAAKCLHQLKGMLSTFDADGVTLDLQDMLDAARKDDSDLLVRSYQQNRGEILELVEAIANLSQP